MLAYLSTTRYEGPEIDRVLVDNDAKAMHKFGERKYGMDEKVLIQIFSERSRTHLVVLDGAYQKMYGRELRKVKIWHFLDRPVSPCDFRIQSGLDKFFPYP